MKRLLILMILMFIAGCAGGTEFSPDFHTGAEGLKINFLENSPPDELLYADEPSQFLIGVGIKNNGAEDIRKGSVRIVSFKNYVKINGGRDCVNRVVLPNFPNIIKCDLPRL